MPQRFKKNSHAPQSTPCRTAAALGFARAKKKKFDEAQADHKIDQNMTQNDNEPHEKKIVMMQIFIVDVGSNLGSSAAA
jgi:hypothetical protein